MNSMFLSSTFLNQRREKSRCCGTCSFARNRAPSRPPNFPLFLLQLVRLPNCSLLSPPQFLGNFCIITPSYVHFSFKFWPRGTEGRSWILLVWAQGVDEEKWRCCHGERGRWRGGRLVRDQSENSIQEGRSHADYISQKPRGLRVVFRIHPTGLLKPEAARERVQVRWAHLAESSKGNGPRPAARRLRRSRSGQVAGQPRRGARARRGVSSSRAAAECRRRRMRRGSRRSPRDGPARASSSCRAARPPWPS